MIFEDLKVNTDDEAGEARLVFPVEGAEQHHGQGQKERETLKAYNKRTDDKSQTAGLMERGGWGVGGPTGYWPIGKRR